MHWPDGSKESNLNFVITFGCKTQIKFKLDIYPFFMLKQNKVWEIWNNDCVHQNHSLKAILHKYLCIEIEKILMHWNWQNTYASKLHKYLCIEIAKILIHQIAKILMHQNCKNTYASKLQKYSCMEIAKLYWLMNMVVCYH